MKGKKLIFISVIKRDGSGTTNIEDRNNSSLDEESFKINPLSLSNETFIASAFNSYVVKKR
jgi:hypothetical protein